PAWPGSGLERQPPASLPLGRRPAGPLDPGRCQQTATCCPNEHYFVYASNFWVRDPYFEWFDHWLKGRRRALIDEPAVFYSPRAWVDERDSSVPDDWVRVERWPPPGTSPQRLYLCGDGSLSADCRGGASRTYRYDPHHPIPSLGGRKAMPVL